MTCPDCTTAATTLHHGGYRANCPGCQARMLAHSPHYAEAEARSTITPAYKAALLQLGTDIRAGHAAVRAWRKVLDGLDLEHARTLRRMAEAGECEA